MKSTKKREKRSTKVKGLSYNFLVVVGIEVASLGQDLMIRTT